MAAANGLKRAAVTALALGVWVAAAVGAGAGAARAADVTYFAEDINLAGDGVRITPTNALAKRAEFLANVSGAVMETFETQSVGSGPQPWTLAFGTLTGTGPNTAMVSVPTGTDGGRFPSSGNVYFRQADEFEPTRYSAVVTLDSPQRAFGVFATDWGDSGFLAGTRPTFTLTYTDTTTATFEAPSSILGTDMTGSAAFFGVLTDKPFNRVEIVNGTGSRTSGYDDMIVAPTILVASTPEPASGSVALAAVLVLFPMVMAVTRRKQRCLCPLEG